jgi:hypothetical protein
MRHLPLMLLIVVSPTIRADDGFVPLFNGKDFTGWTGTTKPDKDGKSADWKSTWSVTDGLLVCTGKPNGYLATTKSYGDYVLRVKWRYPKGATTGNSGVLLHCQAKDEVWPRSIEAQTKQGFAGDVWLNTPPETTLDVPADRLDPTAVRHRWRLDKTKTYDKPIGEWNQYEITCTGGDITLLVNGVKANEGKNGSLKEGRIGLQSEGTEVHFKDIEIKTLK